MAIEFSDFAKLKWYYQGLIVVAAAGGLLALAWYQFLRPMSDEVVEKQGQLQALNQEIAQAAQRQQQLAQIREQSELAEQQLDALKTILPLERETDDIIREVNLAANNASMRVLQYSPRAPQDQEVYSEWAWDFQVQSTYHNMGRFLDAIRQLDRIVNINGIALSAAGDGLTTTVDATYTATTFVYREDESLEANQP
jgi:type IV pilus assembly protein PilO